MKTQISPLLLKKLKKVDVRIRKNFLEKLKIFETNHQEPILNNHALKREYQGYRSINVTVDFRALYEEINEGDRVIAYFSLLGTHKDLYG